MEIWERVRRYVTRKTPQGTTDERTTSRWWRDHEEDRLRDPFRHPRVGGCAAQQSRVSAAGASPEGSLRLCYRDRGQRALPGDAARQAPGHRRGTHRGHGFLRHRCGRALPGRARRGALRPGSGHEVARKANDTLAEAMQRYPDRYRGYAALAPNDPEAAVKELERAVKELGMQGWKTHCNYGDSYLDEKQYWPILAKAEELGAPVYLHPTVPKIAGVLDVRHLSGGAGVRIRHGDSLIAMRLILSGAFDAFPKPEGDPRPLRRGTAVSHAPDGLAVRTAARHRGQWRRGRAPQRKPSQYFRDNFMVTTSGNYLEAAFRCTREALGMQSIMLGTDYPFDNPKECFAFLRRPGTLQRRRVRPVRDERGQVRHRPSGRLAGPPRPGDPATPIRGGFDYNPRLLAMTSLMTSDVPSPISRSLASRR